MPIGYLRKNELTEGHFDQTKANCGLVSKHCFMQPHDKNKKHSFENSQTHLNRCESRLNELAHGLPGLWGMVTSGRRGHSRIEK